MIEFVKELWCWGWDGRLMLLVFLVLAAMVVTILAALVYWAVDSWFRPLRLGRGTISSKTFTPAHTTTQVAMVGKTTTVRPVHHPDSWHVTIRMEDGRENRWECSKEDFDRAQGGMVAAVSYKDGRISGGLYIKKAIW